MNFYTFLANSHLCEWRELTWLLLQAFGRLAGLLDRHPYRGLASSEHVQVRDMFVSCFQNWETHATSFCSDGYRDEHRLRSSERVSSTPTSASSSPWTCQICWSPTWNPRSSPRCTDSCMTNMTVHHTTSKSPKFPFNIFNIPSATLLFDVPSRLFSCEMVWGCVRMPGLCICCAGSSSMAGR